MKLIFFNCTVLNYLCVLYIILDEPRVLWSEPAACCLLVMKFKPNTKQMFNVCLYDSLPLVDTSTCTVDFVAYYQKLRMYPTMPKYMQSLWKVPIKLSMGVLDPDSIPGHLNISHA